MVQAFELYDWIELHKPSHLKLGSKLGDILDWKVGDKHDVAIFDGNFDEVIWDKCTEFKKYKPSDMFKHCRATLEYLGNMKWMIHFGWGESIEHPVHIDVSQLPTNAKWADIEDNGEIHITSEYLNEDQEIPPERKAIHTHWHNFGMDTRVGWRGPIMFWKDIETRPEYLQDYSLFGKNTDPIPVYYVSPSRII